MRRKLINLKCLHPFNAKTHKLYCYILSSIRRFKRPVRIFDNIKYLKEGSADVGC
ncbi:hypothetical protein LEP1GSC050_0717 [Leptospira broomii serovar Hurstbridge str. 5399]|uniref:Uncharacterized protein n=1 Tax=Leptospira broomii serovar Hurstbridge str. 5399 TaxID=1049789 RepID=T0FH08_9LEPT|nr:hypothetical protein LEP1GSC050_0717 [Leptospira broomii serovar Hurstbridge str. 5399]